MAKLLTAAELRAQPLLLQRHLLNLSHSTVAASAILFLELGQLPALPSRPQDPHLIHWVASAMLCFAFFTENSSVLCFLQSLITQHEILGAVAKRWKVASKQLNSYDAYQLFIQTANQFLTSDPDTAMTFASDFVLSMLPIAYEAHSLYCRALGRPAWKGYDPNLLKKAKTVAEVFPSFEMERFCAIATRCPETFGVSVFDAVFGLLRAEGYTPNGRRGVEKEAGEGMHAAKRRKAK